MYCKHCGKTMSDKALVCLKCGKFISASAKEEYIKNQKMLQEKRINNQASVRVVNKEMPSKVVQKVAAETKTENVSENLKEKPKEEPVHLMAIFTLMAGILSSLTFVVEMFKFSYFSMKEYVILNFLSITMVALASISAVVLLVKFKTNKANRIISIISLCLVFTSLILKLALTVLN